MSESMRYDDEAPETPDRLPNAAEVEQALKQYLGATPYKVIASRSDDKGVVLFEVETEVNGAKVEYNFERAKYDVTQPKIVRGARFTASLHAVYYTEDGMPDGGKCVLNFRDGTWSAEEFPNQPTA
jgi:hypothetical protein